MRISIGPWQWRDVAGMSWNLPVGATSALDLRNNTHCAKPIVPEGYGLFVSDTILPPEYIQLADGPDEVLTGQRKASLHSLLKLTGNIQGSKLSDIVYELMTVHSDPDVGVICPPFMPTHRGQLELSFAGVQRSTPFSDGIPEWDNIRKVLWSNYRHYRDRQARGDAPQDFHRKMLTVWMENYKIADFTKFIPPDLPRETPRPHSTTHTETFDQGDSSTVGPNLSWTEVNSAWSTVSNKLRLAQQAGNGSIRADADVSSSDHYSEIVFDSQAVSGGGGGPCARFASAAETYYVAWVYADGNMYFSKVVAGTKTNLASNGQATSLPDTVRLSCSGSTHNIIFNGSTIISDFSDSAIATGTRGGAFGYSPNGTQDYDSFVIADLAAAAGIVGKSYIKRQAVNRASFY